MNPDPILFFDGVCNLCTGTVQFVLRHDKRKLLKMASLQSPLGQKVLDQHQLSLQNFDTLFLLEGQTLYDRSTAVLRMCRMMGGWMSVFYVFIVIPKGLRDQIYKFIARNRFRWFGKETTCWVPDPKWNNRFM